MTGALGAVLSMVTLRALEAAPTLPATSVAVAVRLCVPFRQRRGRVTPGAAAVGRCASDLVRSIEQLDRCVGFSRSAQHQRIVVGDAVARHTTVRRERGNARRYRRRRVDGHAQRRRGCTGIAGRIGGGGGQAVHTVGQRRGRVCPGAASVRGCGADLCRAVKHLNR